MFCEPYRQALSEAAASSETLPRELQLHLAGCAACQSAFAEEQRLFASIDAAMSAAVNAEVPASLLPRVREQIAAEPEKTAWLPFAPMFAITLVMVCVFAVSVLRPRHTASGSWHQDSAGVAPAVVPAGDGATMPSLARANPPVLRMPTKPATKSVRQARVSSEPEVLVSGEERLGFERYSANLRPRAPQIYARLSVAGDSAFRISPLEIAEIGVDELVIDPLESNETN